ncbi:MAG: TIGR03086 family metal-binding protein [Acidimicrobiales bacterium]
MSTEEELPVFPTTAPEVFADPEATAALFHQVLDRLAAVVDVDDAQLARPTPCAGFDVAGLQRHVLGWLRFFAAALNDPTAAGPRPDPDSFVLEGASASDVVRRAEADIARAVADDVAGQLVVMSQARMAGDGVLAMALGEYIIHAWDLATATGRSYSAPDAAVGAAHEFLDGMVTADYRGPDSGFFDAEIPVAADAAALDRLLGFAGRDPGWMSPAG